MDTFYIKFCLQMQKNVKDQSSPQDQRLWPCCGRWTTCLPEARLVVHTQRSGPYRTPWSWRAEQINTNEIPCWHTYSPSKYQHVQKIYPCFHWFLSQIYMLLKDLLIKSSIELTWYNRWLCWGDEQWWTQCSQRTLCGWFSGWVHPSPGPQQLLPRPWRGLWSSLAEHEQGIPVAFDQHCSWRKTRKINYTFAACLGCENGMVLHPEDNECYISWMDTSGNIAKLPQILSAFRDLMIQACRQSLNKGFQVGMLQGCPQFLVSVNIKWIKVHLKAARK